MLRFALRVHLKPGKPFGKFGRKRARHMNARSG
jgi:hypothetical protein